MQCVGHEFRVTLDVMADERKIFEKNDNGVVLFVRQHQRLSRRGIGGRVSDSDVFRTL